MLICMKCDRPIDQELIDQLASLRARRGMEPKPPKVCSVCLLHAISNMEEMQDDGSPKA